LQRSATRRLRELRAPSSSERSLRSAANEGIIVWWRAKAFKIEIAISLDILFKCYPVSCHCACFDAPFLVLLDPLPTWFPHLLEGFSNSRWGIFEVKWNRIWFMTICLRIYYAFSL
jgi:hypothetical protein